MIKVDVISGFLGAGKTTLIKKLYKDVFKNEKVVLIENEFGEIGIDGAFLQESGIEIKEINSGCICCSLVGDFSSSMKEVVEKFVPERIIIEPSGVGKLSDILTAIDKVDEDLSLNVVITVVDSGKCKMYHKNFGEFYNNQVENAKVVIMTKSEKISEEKLIDAVNLIKRLNGTATIVTTPITMINGVDLLHTLENIKSFYEEVEEEMRHERCCHQGHNHDHDCCCGHHEHEHHHDHEGCCEHHEHEHHHDHEGCCGHHEHEHHHDHEGYCGHHEHEHHHDHHHADEVFTSWGVDTAKSFSKIELEKILNALTNEDSSLGIILRAKGIVKASDDEKWYYFDLVSGEYEIRVGEPYLTGKLCVIGSNLNEEKINCLFFKE